MNERRCRPPEGSPTGVNHPSHESVPDQLPQLQHRDDEQLSRHPNLTHTSSQDWIERPRERLVHRLSFHNLRTRCSASARHDVRHNRSFSHGWRPKIRSRDAAILEFLKNHDGRALDSNKEDKVGEANQPKPINLQTTPPSCPRLPNQHHTTNVADEAHLTHSESEDVVNDFAQERSSVLSRARPEDDEDVIMVDPESICAKDNDDDEANENDAPAELTEESQNSGPRVFHFRTSAEAALQCPMVVQKRPRMRRRMKLKKREEQQSKGPG